MALTDEEIYAGFRIPFRATGARASAMGGAGLAVVDDGAAARLNPARLAAIVQPELVFEAQAASHDDRIESSGFTRFDPSINPLAGSAIDQEFSMDEGLSPGYVAFSWPFKVLARPIAMGLSRSVASTLSVDATTVSRLTPLSAPAAGDDVLRISRGRLDADLVLYDLAAGVRLTPTFAIGAGLTMGRLDLSSRTVGSLADPLQVTGPGASDPRYSGPAPSPLVKTTGGGIDTDLAYAFGVWWKPGHALSLATVYRQGVRFGIPTLSRDLLTGRRESFTNIVRQPDTAVVGVAWTPLWNSPSANLQGLTVGFDLERVKYADLIEGFREGENVLTRTDFVRDVDYSAQDATEAHLGLEYRRSFPTWTLALRGGLYNRRDGWPRLDGAAGDVGGLQGQSRVLRESSFFRSQGDDVHGTLGLGARLHSLSIDAALDLSQPADRLIVSTTWRLGRR